MATAAPLTFDEVINHYRVLLEANPGKALLICGGGNLALLQDGEVVGAPLGRDAIPDIGSVYDFEPGAFDDQLGCWYDDTPAETMARIQNPTFVNAGI